jgi:hypothetical protein
MLTELLWLIASAIGIGFILGLDDAGLKLKLLFLAGFWFLMVKIFG